MRISEFWRRMSVGFGAVYARSVAEDHRLSTLSATANEALARGVPAKTVWRAICTDFDIPAQLH